MVIIIQTEIDVAAELGNYSVILSFVDNDDNDSTSSGRR